MTARTPSIEDLHALAKIGGIIGILRTRWRCQEGTENTESGAKHQSSDSKSRRSLGFVSKNHCSHRRKLQRKDEAGRMQGADAFVRDILLG